MCASRVPLLPWSLVDRDFLEAEAPVPVVVTAVWLNDQVLEVVAETSAPLTPYEELLSAAPSDESQADKFQRLRAAAEAEQQIEAARQRVRSIHVLYTTV